MKENISTKTLNHTVSIDNRKKTLITGVVEVLSSTDKALLAKTQTHVISVVGENLRINKLNLDENVLIIDGEVNELKYSIKNKAKNIFKRLIK